MPGEFSDFVGEAPASAGLSVPSIAAAVGVPEHLVMQAVRAGCRTEREVREWLRRSGTLR